MMASEVIRVIHALEDDELDCLPFGVIYLDREGMVLRYNATESKLSGRKPADVTGRLFFSEVAPCTDVPEFSGQFFSKVDRERLDEHFDFVFPFQPPRTVRVHMLSGPAKTAWILITDSTTSPITKAELDKTQVFE